MVLLIGTVLPRGTIGMDHHVGEAPQEVTDHLSGVCLDPEVGIMSQGMRVLQEEVQGEEGDMGKTEGVTEETIEGDEANLATRSEPFSLKATTRAHLYPSWERGDSQETSQFVNLQANDRTNRPTNIAWVLAIRALQVLVTRAHLVLVTRAHRVHVIRAPSNTIVVLLGPTTAPHLLSHTASVIQTSAVSHWLTQDPQAPEVVTTVVAHRHRDTEAVRVVRANQGVLLQSCTIHLRLSPQSQSHHSKNFLQELRRLQS